jgi:hypothetical protein
VTVWERAVTVGGLTTWRRRGMLSGRSCGLWCVGGTLHLGVATRLVEPVLVLHDGCARGAGPQDGRARGVRPHDDADEE